MSLTCVVNTEKLLLHCVKKQRQKSEESAGRAHDLTFYTVLESSEAFTRFTNVDRRVLRH